MQTNVLKIDSYDGLFTMFTTLEPTSRRMAVLQAIADPETKIGHTWNDCLFAVAARAANRSLIKKSIFLSRAIVPADSTLEVVAKALGIPLKWVQDIVPADITLEVAAKDLGIPLKWVQDGVAIWDANKEDENQCDAANEAFRNCIRKHLAELEKETAPQTLLPA